MEERHKRQESATEDVIRLWAIVDPGDSPGSSPESNPVFTALLKHVRFLAMSCISPDNVYTHTTNDPSRS
jgi:hypothetical protein